MPKVRTIVVGTGGIARHHVRRMLEMKRSTVVCGCVEVSDRSRQAMLDLFNERKMSCPPFYPTVRDLIRAQGAPDAALICTPHKFHFENTRDCLLNGMDVCLEKPMVMNADEARRLIRLRDRTGRLLVVAFPGSLSPAVRKARKMIADGLLGRVTAIAAYVHQHWKQGTTGTWRQDPEISGGGFLFDTGSHMVNTVVDLLNEDVAQVNALLDQRGAPVEICSAVSGRSKSGILFSMTAAGDSIQCCSQITVFGDRGIIETGIWGERLRFRKPDQWEFTPVEYPKSAGIWEEFLRVRSGKTENPCPPEVGLRFAKLMDMIRLSARTGTTARCRVGRLDGPGA
jgi:predicted dehydrogenase